MYICIYTYVYTRIDALTTRPCMYSVRSMPGMPRRRGRRSAYDILASESLVRGQEQPSELVTEERVSPTHEFIAPAGV